MGELTSAFSALNWSVLTNMLISIIPALICITLHELAHGFVAYKLGDTTAKDAGRLTLNPIKHIDIFGLVMMIAYKFGWAKPVPVNMNNFKNPKRGMAITAFAGPCMNILLSGFVLAIFGFVYVPLYENQTILDTIYTTAYLSCALAIFNLIPVPPLDGSKVLFSLLPNETYYKLMRYERYGMIALMLLLVSGVLDTPLSTVTGFVFDKLFYIAQWTFDLYSMLF